MARVTLKADFSHIGESIKRTINGKLIKIGKSLANEYSANLKSLIKERAKLFKEAEKKLWDALGKAEHPQPGAFGEITGKLKKGTGYVITLNGVRISSSNTILGSPITRKMRLKGNEFSPHKKRNNQYRRNFAVGIAIFSTVPYADAVNNPNRKKLKNMSYYKGHKRLPGELYAGTGWFDIYTTLLTNMFYQAFLKSTPSIKDNKGTVLMNKNSVKKFTIDANVKKSINGNAIQTAAAESLANSIFNLTTGGKGKINFSRIYKKGSNGKRKTKYVAKPFVVKDLNINISYKDIENYLL